MRGLKELELKARVSHIIAVLRRFLPQEIPRAIETLAQVKGHWDWGNPDDPLACLAAWPVTDFIAEYGLEYFEESMHAMRGLTALFSAEFAIRPFIERYPERTLALLHEWTKCPDAHVRRLVSEARDALASQSGVKQRWSYVYSPDADFQGLLESQLPSFWKSSLSRLFASADAPATPRGAHKLNPQKKARRAKELRSLGYSYGQIAQELGVSKSTVVNYLKGYPYRRQ